MDLSVGLFFIVQVVWCWLSTRVFLKKNCHVFSKKIAKSVVDTRFLKIQKIPNFFVPEKKEKGKKNIANTQLKELLNLKKYFSKPCLRMLQVPTGGVAQMEERSLCMREVPGSIPGVSIMPLVKRIEDTLLQSFLLQI